MRPVWRLVALVTMIAVAGCAGGDDIEAIYELSALPSPTTGNATTAQLLVPEPMALQSLATERIAVKPTALTLAYYPQVAYQDVAPKVMQHLLLHTFQNTGQVRAVGLPGESLLINYSVVTELRAFQVETFAGARAKAELAVKLLNDANGRVVSTQVFTTIVPLTSDSPEAAAEGLNIAAQQLALDVVDWTLAAI